jgi:hypothetical protein
VDIKTFIGWEEDDEAEICSDETFPDPFSSRVSILEKYVFPLELRAK